MQATLNTKTAGVFGSRITCNKKLNGDLSGMLAGSSEAMMPAHRSRFLAADRIGFLWRTARICWRPMLLQIGLL